MSDRLIHAVIAACEEGQKAYGRLPALESRTKADVCMEVAAMRNPE